MLLNIVYVPVTDQAMAPGYYGELMGIGVSLYIVNVLIYDMGGGTFDVFLLIIEDGIFEVKQIEVTFDIHVKVAESYLGTKIILEDLSNMNGVFVLEDLPNMNDVCVIEGLANDERHNADESRGYKLGVDMFSDLIREEFIALPIRSLMDSVETVAMS